MSLSEARPEAEALAMQLFTPVMLLGQVPESVGGVWSEPETLCVGAGETVLPQASETVKVLVTVHPQLLVEVFKSLCWTDMLPQSEKRATTSSSLSSPERSALSKQLACPVMSSGQVPASMGAVLS